MADTVIHGADKFQELWRDSKQRYDLDEESEYWGEEEAGE